LGGHALRPAPCRVAATTDNGRVSVAVPTAGADNDRGRTLTTVNGDVAAALE
jgi:hypothetical protein